MPIALDEMKSVCMVYHVSLPDLPEAHEDVAGDSLEGKADLVIADLT